MEGEKIAIDAISSEFITEIKEDLSGLESDLLVLEEKDDDIDDALINRVFRSIHSIKGGAGFIDFKPLSILSHAMENVLMQLREKKMTISPDITDALLSGFDKMKLMADLIGTGRSCDYNRELEALKKILEKTDPVPVIETSETELRKSLVLLTPLGTNPCFDGKTFFVDQGRLDKALENQKFIYGVHIPEEKDPQKSRDSARNLIKDIENVGDLLYSGLETPPFYCVVSTILDLPLLAQVLEITADNLALMDKQFTDSAKILKSISTQTGKIVSDTDTGAVVKSTQPPKMEKQTAAPHPETQVSGHPRSGQTIRVNMDLISNLMTRAGELVLSRNQMRSVMENAGVEDGRVSRMMQNLDMVATELQQGIMQMRMQPVSDLLGKYKRMVRDVARRMDKKVELVLEGADVEVDRNILEKLANPMTHLIRNSIDHGIENPEERLAAGKPESGTLFIETTHQGGHVHIRIRDDGAGIDPQLVLSKAFEKGLITEEEVNRLNDRQKVALVFLPGFSTSKEITDISGRGVGMDVVKTNIERLRGQIEIESAKGEGTAVHLTIPLTLSIIPSLIVSAGNAKFAIPQANIKEVIYLEPGKIHGQVGTIAGSEVLRLRQRLIPIMRLRNLLDLKTYVTSEGANERLEEKRKAIADRRQSELPADIPEKRAVESDRRKVKWDATYVVLLKLGRNLFGLCIDELWDIEEVVVEPLNECIKHLKCFAGATILGNGDVIMILDVPGIASFCDLKFDSFREAEQERKHSVVEKARKKNTPRDLIIFSSAPDEYFAMELKDLKRLEPFKPSDIHRTDTLKYVEHNREAVPLFSMDEFLPAAPCDFTEDQVFVIFPKNTPQRVGILASRIIDTTRTEASFSREGEKGCVGPLMGKLFIQEKMVQVLDQEKLSACIGKKTGALEILGKKMHENSDS